MCVLVAQLCPTLCDPMNSNLPGSSVHGILQARILEWVAFPSPGNLPDPGIEPRSPTLQADSLPSEPPGKPSLKIAPIFLLIRGVFLQINFCWHIVDLLCCVSFLLYSKVNQSFIYIYPFFLRFPSHLGHYRALSRVPCAIQ